MIHKKRILVIFIICLVLLVVIGVSRINTYSPVGAIRYECLLNGHIISALFMHVTNIKINDETTAYKITSFIPYEKATATHLDQWNVKKNKNGTYSASYGKG
jgi:hypothetical protein